MSKDFHLGHSKKLRGALQRKHFMDPFCGFPPLSFLAAPFPIFPWVPIEADADTLAWATGTRVGASNHAIELFCIRCGRVLGFLYGDTLQYILWFNCAHYYMFYICGCEAHFVINSLFVWILAPVCGVSVSVLESRKRSWRGGGTPATDAVLSSMCNSDLLEGLALP